MTLSDFNSRYLNIIKILTILLIIIFNLTNAHQWNFKYAFIILTLGLVINLFLYIFNKGKPLSRKYVGFQIWINYILGTLFLLTIGGLENPSFHVFYTFMVIVAFLFLGKKQGYLVFTISNIFFIRVYHMGLVDSSDILSFIYIMITNVMLSYFLIHNYEKSNRLDKKLKEFEALYKLSKIIDKFPSTQIILDNAAAIICKTLEIEECLIMLYDEEKDKLSTRARYGNINPAMEKAVFKKGEGVSGKVLLEKKSVISSNLLKDKDILNSFKYDFGIRSCAIIPLIHNDIGIGVIAVYSIKKYEFTRDAIELLDIIASRIVKVLENKDLYSKIKESAITDGLTNLYNHRYFYEVLNQKLKEAMKNHSKLFLLMMDIDKFKLVNDKFGHVVGDKVICEIANIIKESIRSTDIAARYGGEEFAIILPNADPNIAYKVGKRIKEMVKRINDSIDELKYNDHGVTISIGVSCYPTCTRDMKTLIELADMRMYNGKEHGGDKVVVEMMNGKMVNGKQLRIKS